ncbi:PrsW family intramembrane metalloprotease [Alicyclobacillus tolerans]|uniref:PrsW family intramembrane metalloprotease n=1 Tax=Alicyclobacillus tolerans TaxID=90970 RepID=UPI001F027BF1|nr:PrsW family glutamic-type intramembrane protease [Alicyclobacillus tolerans]MCF8563700.1 PrsW family intramembrane metalloprotease [Alicyclobacillus tolerans]
MLYVALALLPAMLLMVWLYTRDTLHPEPKRAVYRLFLLGAAIVLPAGLLERSMLDSGVAADGLRATFMTAFFVAGLVEEFLKAGIVDRSAVQAGLVKNPLDSIVYSGAVALGFASVENILYVTSSGFSTAILRSVTAVPAHFMFGILMGNMFARSLFYGKSRALAYILPALAHGVYDAFALTNTWIGDGLLVAYLVFLLEMSLRQIEWASRHSPVDRRQVKTV